MSTECRLISHEIGPFNGWELWRAPVGIIILNIFPIDFHVKTKNFLFSVTLL